MPSDCCEDVRGLAVGDINNDGLDDIVFTSIYPKDVIGIFKQNGNGMFLPLEIYPSYREPTIVRIGTVVGKFKDIVVLHAEWDKLGLYTTAALKQKYNYFVEEKLFPLSYNTWDHSDSLAIGDINNDGSNDIVITNITDGLVVFYHKKVTKPMAPPALPGILPLLQ